MPRMVSVRGSSRAKYLAAIAGLAVMATPAAAQIKADAVRIGVLTDMAGIFATAMGPGSVEAAKMAAEEFGNKINGKPIQILYADHQNKPDVAASTARQWFHRDGVQADRGRRQFRRIARCAGTRTGDQPDISCLGSRRR